MPRAINWVVVGVMLVGYYAIYLLTHLDVEFLVSTTFDRLMVQIWPSLVLAAFFTDAGPGAGRPHGVLDPWSPGTRSSARL